MTESQLLQFQANTRRSQRVAARIRVKVLRQEGAGEMMSEETHTLVVNAHGALISLAMVVRPGEALTLENLLSRDRQQSRVVRVGEKQASKHEVAIEFSSPAPHFWHIDFPPADWKPIQD
jgi:hypothetical protein